jgi:hypothetical protein
MLWPQLYGHPAASVAKLALSDTNSPASFIVPLTEPSSSRITLDDKNAKGQRSMGLLDHHRVIIEWKRISLNLDGEQRDKVIQRVGALGHSCASRKNKSSGCPIVSVFTTIKYVTRATSIDYRHLSLKSLVTTI